ncbi:MAG: polyprenyl synthetase family protein [Phycisphaerae bacterium]|jgi:geranylgeranyl pyrophosphate synthase
MDFTFFYTQEQLNGFLNSKFKSTVLCPKTDRIVETTTSHHENNHVSLSPKLENILEEIAITKELVDPLIERYIESVEDKSILQLLKYNNKTWSWREKSFLTRACALTLGAEFTMPLIKATAGIELMGMSFCLIDDIIDESSFYDLKQTTWAKYGYKEAICASQILISLAHKALIDACSEAKISGDYFEKVMQTFRAIQGDAYTSQFMDIESEKTSIFSEDSYFKMTSKFPGTFYKGAIQIACLLSSINDDRVTKLQEFGRLLAIANQIRDDLIEIIGDEQVIGKKIGADISQKKKRLPLIVFLRTRHDEYKEFLLSKAFKEIHAKEVLCKIQSNGVVDACIAHVNTFIDNAVEQLTALGKNKWTDLLENLAESVTDFR